jgi:hypothetical protein
MSALITSLAISTVSTGISYRNARKQRKAQQSANRTQREINAFQNRQQKRQFLRAFRQAQADSIQTAIAAGVGLDSSAVGGNISSLRSQAGTAVRETAKLDELGGRQFAQINQASKYGFQAQTASSVASFAQSFGQFWASRPTTPTTTTTQSGAVAGLDPQTNTIGALNDPTQTTFSTTTGPK